MKMESSLADGVRSDPPFVLSSASNAGAYRRTCRDDWDFNESYTSERRPLTLVWQETFASREEALGQERKLRGSQNEFDSSFDTAFGLLRTNG